MADHDDPTWGEVIAAWDPDLDGQGNTGLANAAERITAERSIAALERTAEVHRSAGDRVRGDAMAALAASFRSRSR